MKVNVNCVAFGLIKTHLTEATGAAGASINVEGRDIKVGVNPELMADGKDDSPPSRWNTRRSGRFGVPVLHPGV